MTAIKLLTEALPHIESSSIREWAGNSHNRPIFRKLAKNAITKNPKVTPESFATYIVGTAIGL